MYKNIITILPAVFFLVSSASAHMDEWCNKDYAAPNSTLKECIHGEFRCTDTSTDRCNWGQWVANPCAVGTKCIACGDFECVQNERFEDLSKQLCPPAEVLEKKKAEEEKQKVEAPCEHGAFRCTDKSTDRCNFGVWIAHPCAAGTKCLGCGDFECIRVEEFSMWEQMLCVAGTKEDDKEHLEHMKTYYESKEESKGAPYSGATELIASLTLLCASVSLSIFM